MIELTPQRQLERKAERFALLAHAGQMYGNHQYGYHLGQVVENVKRRISFDNPLYSTYIAVAWLHDTIEDTAVTFEDLNKEFGMAIAYSVQQLTKSGDYHEYLQRCIDCAIAREVKIADTMANLTESFNTGNAKGLAKYPKQLHMLIGGVVA